MRTSKNETQCVTVTLPSTAFTRSKKEWAAIGHHLRYCRVCNGRYTICKNGQALTESYLKKHPDIKKRIEDHGHKIDRLLATRFYN